MRVAGDEGVDLHARGVFRQQGIEIAAQLVLHALGGEIGIHQIAEIEHLGESPETAIATIVFTDNILIVGKEGLGDVEILLVVDLIPFLVPDGQRLHVVTVQQGDDTQHVLVVLRSTFS